MLICVAESHLSSVLQAAAAGDVRSAVAMLRRAGLTAEAAALASARLLPDDPTVQVCDLHTRVVRSRLARAPVLIKARMHSIHCEGLALCLILYFNHHAMQALTLIAIVLN